ncbi:TonB-dependent siderophore receptor [Achromobacter marplatensis]|uniref:TonB-dependent siderophore receptor n=1 Tax=Achromobacter marplatensis TaxID=470868 RepID=UPI0039F64A07
MSQSCPANRPPRLVPPVLLSLSFVLRGLPPALAVLAAATSAHAQPAPMAFAIPPGPLDTALGQFGHAAKVSVAADPRLTEGLQSPGLQGSYPIAIGLARLLEGTGLEPVAQGGGYTLRRVAGTTAILEAVTVTGRLDATSEGQDSYAAQAATIGKRPQALREIPQSVSVITRQQIEDQNLTTVHDALNKATGVTASTQGDGTSIFYSRGYALEAQYDGVPTGFSSLNGYSQLDMAVYDRLEVLRGPSGLLQGAGDPGGSVNFVRKRPLREFQVTGSMSAGSWDNYHTDLDITGPLNDSGSIRGRTVLAAEDRGYFYDTGKNKQVTAYAVLDLDLTSSTTLSLSGALQRNKLSGRANGLPTYADGSFLDVPRSTSVGERWQTREYPITEGGVELKQELANEWSVNTSFRYRRTNLKSNYLYTTSAVDPLTNLVDFTGRRTDWPAINRDFDINVGGPVNLFGLRHEFLLGYNRSFFEMQGDYSSSSFPGRDVLSPGLGDVKLESPSPSFLEQEIQSGVYGTARLKLAEPLTLVLGGRITEYEHRSRSADGSGAWTYYGKESGKFTPFGGLVWDVNQTVTLYGSYASIFKPQSAIDVSGNALKPRVGWQAEAGMKLALIEDRLHANLAVFRIRDQNRAITDPDPSHVCNTWNGACSVAAGLVQSQGWEFEISGKPLPNWDIIAGYTFNDTKYLKDSVGGNQGRPFLSTAPRHLFKLWSIYRLDSSDLGGVLDGWSVGAGVNAQSATSAGSDDARVRQGGFYTVSAQIGYRVNRDVSLTLTGNNLFDRHYYERVDGVSGYNFIGAPRNVMLTLRATYH